MQWFRSLLSETIYFILEFVVPLNLDVIVDDIALDKVFLQNAVCPFAELNAPLALDTVAYGDDDIEVIERNRFLYAINV